MQNTMFSTKIGIQDGNVWFCKALTIKIYEFGDVVVCVYVCFTVRLFQVFSALSSISLSFFVSLSFCHMLLWVFLALSIYLSLSVLLSYPLSVDLLFVCEREKETMIFRTGPESMTIIFLFPPPLCVFGRKT